MINLERAKKCCRDDISKIENYDKAINDTTQTWVCHHRLELTLDGEFANKAEDLERFGMYYDRPYFELIFLTQSEHSRLHNSGERHPMYGRPRSAEIRRKISEAMKGKPHKLHKSRGPHSDEHRRKLSEAKKAYWANKKKNA